MKNGMHEDEDGNKIWYLNGVCHREDGPAIIFVSGTKQWYKNGKCHREDGPAIVDADGDKFWFLNGKWHPSFGSWLKELDVSDEDALILTLKWT